MDNPDLKKMGKWMADELGEAPRDEVMDERQAFLEQVATRRGSRRPMVVVLAAAAAIILAVSAYSLFSDMATVSTYRPGTPSAEGHQVLAGKEGGEVIRFDSGSEFAVDAGSIARVVSSTQDEVIIGLAQGTVDCVVNGNGHTRWMVRAGGHQVLVTGTQFTVRYEPEALFLAVEVTEGSVQVTGDSLNAHGIRLAAGEHIRVEGGQVKLTQGQEPENKKSRRAKARRKGKRHRPASASAEAVEVTVDEESVARTYEELWQDGKSARHQGRGEEAYAILQELRTRFPGKPYARQATFLLGRIALETRRDSVQAKRWFESYLDGSPSGALAEESIGRLISICRGMNSACAQSYAKRYISHYPNGPFAELAQSVLE